MRSRDGRSGDTKFYVLRDYALIADGQRGALLSPDGDVAWMCFPMWHDPAVLAGMVGSGGFFRVRPRGPFVWGGSYEPGTLIWKSRWVAGEGIVECREALACPSQRNRAILLRRITAVAGSAEVELTVEPSADYGRADASSWRHTDHGLVSGSGEWLWRLSGVDEAVASRSGRLELTVEVVTGEYRDLVLEIAPREAVDDGVEAEELWRATEHHWSLLAPEVADGMVAERDVRHSVAVLFGLTGPSGGTVAAVTAALPERADASRNYDYRFVWIRDLCYVGLAGAELGARSMVEPAMRFVRDRLLADGEALMPAYTVEGEAVPLERRLGIPGYPGGGDVIGNHVRDQFQLDAFGEALRLFAAADGLGLLDADGWRAVEAAAAAIESRWREPDAGIWELDDDNWTHSRLICVAGLREVSARPSAPSPAWEGLADAILAAASAEAIHPSGRWQRSPSDERIDASLLLAGLAGVAGSDEQRTVKTYEAVVADLVRDDYVYRFPQVSGQPLGDEEGAFVLCNFWLSLAALEQGDTAAAVRWFERGRAGCGPPGLFAEEFDVAQRQLRGNIPQAFVHAELIHAAVAQGQLGR